MSRETTTTTKRVRSLLELEKDDLIPDEIASSIRAVVELAKEDPARAALVARQLRAVENITREASDRDVLSALSEPSDLGALDRTMRNAVAKVVEITFESSRDIETQKAKQAHFDQIVKGAETRAVAIKSEILDREGSPFNSVQVGKKLGIKRTALLARRKKGTIISLPAGRHGFLYPRWQFGEGEYGLVSGLYAVLRVLQQLDPWSKSLFLLKKHPAIQWLSPLEALQKGKLDIVLSLAREKADGR